MKDRRRCVYHLDLPLILSTAWRVRLVIHAVAAVVIPVPGAVLKMQLIPVPVVIIIIMVKK